MYLQVISTLAFGKKQVCPRTGLLLSLSAQFFVQLRRRDVMVVSVAIFFLSSLAASGGNSHQCRDGMSNISVG